MFTSSASQNPESVSYRGYYPVQRFLRSDNHRSSHRSRGRAALIDAKKEESAVEALGNAVVERPILRFRERLGLPSA